MILGGPSSVPEPPRTPVLCDFWVPVKGTQIKWRSFFGGNLTYVGRFLKHYYRSGKSEGHAGALWPITGSRRRGNPGAVHTHKKYLNKFSDIRPPSLSLFFFVFFPRKEYAGHIRVLDWSMLSLCIIGSKGPQGERRDSFSEDSFLYTPLICLTPSSSHTEGRKVKPAAGLTHKANLRWGCIIERGCSSSWVVPSSPNVASWIEMNV